MRTVAVGSVALDTIHARGEVHTDILGGSGAFFGLAAAHFGSVGLVAVVGDDFPAAHLARLRERGVDLGGLERAAGRTFRWEGSYAADLKDRRTLSTEVGVFAGFRPRLPESYRAPGALFLANIDPELQLDVLDQVAPRTLVAVDTMNYWIERKPEALRRVIRRADVLLVNDEEAALLTGHRTLAEAVEGLRAMGPSIALLKMGPHGVLVQGPWGWLAQPGLPLTTVADPTGAGDSFAGGLVGYLGGRAWRERATFAQAVAVGTAVASLSVEGVGVEGLARDRSADIRERCARLREMTDFEVPSAL
jgi:sugar/nucleoside kinase (ribokinase family)